MSKRSTIVDIARVAGVTPKTVSRALNDAPHVSEAVRRKVKEAAAALDYHPNLAAQSLIARRSYLIGLTYERPSPSYVVELQNGALGRLENERYRLVVLPFNHVASRPEELGKLLLRAGLDGVLLAPPACDQPVLLDMIERQRLPYARITPHSDLDRGLVVAMDEVAAGHTVAAHMLSLGHRRVGIILGDPSHAASRGRLEGYRQAFDEAGVAIDDSLVGTGDFTYDVGYRVALELLDRPVRPTAILAQNDDMAVAAIAAARDLGLSVPQDLSVAGFDNSEVSRTAWPPLTTVHQPVREMAWDAANRLIAMLDGDADSDAPRRRDHLHELLVRASTAAPSSAE
ncbi:MAG: LacI family DNA-binding transcriptional regulator [Alphaproteobacteria bacterium]|nr:LacI family DNA-binding transcriptional regulator [Alphaproteobacteria bacterium]MBU0866126.1 LacI family DNA-binding transcriptional regulator [Alphaproteobacteria bacterium]MBU1823763.1 LacI family DNA-binding transcriptional regulator [Alphaproteobacteria bacterium]